MNSITKKKSFSKFTYKQAFQQLKIHQLLLWNLESNPVEPSEFFHQRLTRLRRFDLKLSEESKKLLVDAVFEEGIQQFETLKIWKGAPLDTDTMNGNVDYLVAKNQDYLEAPILCVVEAKKDDFEKGLAQCLVEMQACQWNNQQIDIKIDVFGSVSNGYTWVFYKLTTAGSVYETLPYSIKEMDDLLGVLCYIFQQCEQNLQQSSSQFCN